MYMHHFGGVYADLDLVPLGTFPSQLPILQNPHPNRTAISYLGYMGDKSYAHSIPNAFMVSSTAGHPFWLRPLRFIKEHQNDTAYSHYPEYLTGPVALRSCVLEWAKERGRRKIAGELAELVVLSSDKVTAPHLSHDGTLPLMSLSRSIHSAGTTRP
jgi:mannosyltransferase OCH1-like enzyme